MPERLYRLVGREPTGFGLGGRRLSRFVGRDRELDLLRARLAEARQGRGHVVGVMGEPGVGKSRLLFELRRQLAPEGVTCLEARCASDGGAVPYLPFTDLLRREWRIGEDEAPASIDARVRACLADLGLPPDDAAPSLLRLLGVSAGTEAVAILSPEALKLRTLAALRETLLAHARRGPLVLMLEDLHWIDPTSHGLLASLVEALPSEPILLVVTARPGYEAPWLAASHASQLALPPLTVDESLIVIRSVLPDDRRLGVAPGDVAARAEGNPFFLEELAWAAADGVTVAPGRIPPTITAALAARMDQLGARARPLLEAAAVLGREFSLRLLEAVAGRPSDLQPTLQSLIQRDFLYEQPNRLYVFKHALTQDVAYGRLAATDRRRLHQTAGHAYESLYAGRLDEVVDRLAHHYARTEDHARAVDYLTRAADRAIRTYALDEGLAALGEALARVGRLPSGRSRDQVTLDVVVRHALPLIIVGRIQDASDLLARYETLAEAVEDPGRAALYYFWVSHAYDHLGDRERAVRAADRALAEATQAGDRATLGKVRAANTLRCFWAGELARGADEGRQATALLDGGVDRWWCAQSNLFLAMVHVARGDFDQALEAAGRTRALGEMIEDRRLQSYAAWCTGWADALRGDWPRGVRECDRALSLAPDPFATATALSWAGRAHLEGGQTAEAIAVLDRAAGLWRTFHLPQMHAWMVAWLAEAHLLEGHAEHARALAADALRLATEARFPLALASARRLLGWIARAEGKLEDAARGLADALAIFTAIDARYEIGRTRLELAPLSRDRDRPSEAAMHLAEAHALFTEAGAPYWVERSASLRRELDATLFRM